MGGRRRWCMRAPGGVTCAPITMKGACMKGTACTQAAAWRGGGEGGLGGRAAVRGGWGEGLRGRAESPPPPSAWKAHRAALVRQQHGDAAQLRV